MVLSNHTVDVRVAVMGMALALVMCAFYGAWIFYSFQAW